MPTAQPDNIIYRNVKDSVFKALFYEPKYLLQLYQVLHPEDRITRETDLKQVTLNAVITKGILNDLGFTMRDKLIVLVEAQSTWTVNIIVRSLFYLAQTYQDYLTETDQSLFTSKPVYLPKPELYVVYTGSAKVEKTEISLIEEFFPDESSIAIDMRVKVITEREDNWDILNQYIFFTRVIDEQIKIYGYSREAAKETLRICKGKNILKEFIKRNEKEVLTVMERYFTQAAAVKDWGKAQYAEGRQEGRIEALFQTVKTLMETMDWTASQAAEKMEVSEFDKAQILERLKE